MKKQLIPDILFERGITLLSQKDHANGDHVRELYNRSFTPDQNADAEKPLWKLAQWDSGPCLYENLAPSAPGEITDGAHRLFGYDRENDIMTFRLDTGLYYGDKPARLGDYWPHLLIEQPTFGYAAASDGDKEFFSCGADRIICSFDVRLTSYSHIPKDGDWVRAAQLLMFFYVKGIKTNDFCWFGIKLFDSRVAKDGNYIGYDGGKADASGAMIYSIGTDKIYPSDDGMWKNGSPCPDGEWKHVEIDIKPYLEDMLKVGATDKYFKAGSLSELCINGMNLGWETIGTFDHSAQIRSLRLTSYLDR